MPCRSVSRLLRFALTLTLAGALAGVQAAELGDVAVHSYIGQPLVADIELTGLTADEAAGLRVHLAPADVYRGANVTMNPALSSLHLSVARHDDRQFLHVTSIRPVNAEYLHLFLELGAGDRMEVRIATLWLTADPAPPPPPLPPAPPATAAASEPDAMSPALAAATARAAMRSTPPTEPYHAPQHKPAPAENCGPRYTAAQINACIVLDKKSALLNAQIGDLEGKVKTLQDVVIGKPAAPVTPRRKASLPPPKEVKKAPPAPGIMATLSAYAAAVPLWGWIGAGGGLLVLASLVLGLRYWRNKKKAQAAAPPPEAPAEEAQPGLLARLGARFRRKPAAEAA